VHVQKDDRRGLGLDRRPRLGERPGLADVEALPLEIHPAQEPDRRLVVHDEDDRAVPPRD
jgi:hypothetical protein